MGIDSLNIQNKSLIQAAMLKKSQGTQTVANNNPTALAMSKNGSIFNLVSGNKESSKLNPKADLANQNVFKSLDDLNKPAKKPTVSKKDDSMKKPGSASEGKAQAREVQNQSNDLKSQTKVVQQDAKTANKFTADSQKLDAQIQKDDKKFASQLKKQQAELKRDNQRLDKLIKEQEETQQEIDNAQHELDSLMASSSFSVAKGSNGTQSSNPNQARIAELQEYIGAKVSGMQANGKAIYSLQRSSNKILSRMNKTNARFINAQKINHKALEKQESTTDKILKVATKIEQVSQLVTASGQTLKMLGELMIAAGTTPWTAWMVPVGTVMAKVGTVAEMLGNYGQSAANITKTAAYAADGNIMGAMQSCAAAAMTGAAAVKSTKGLKDEFGKINEQAKEANVKREANIEAKKTVEGLQNEAVEAAQLKAQTEGKTLTKEEIKYIKKNAIKDSNGNVINARQAKAAISADLQNRSAQGGDLNVATRHNQYKQGKEVKGKISGQGSTSFNNAKKTGFTNTVASNSTKTSTSWSDKLNNISKCLTMTAAVFGQNNTYGYNDYMSNPYNMSGSKRKSNIAKFNEWKRAHGTHRSRRTRHA